MSFLVKLVIVMESTFLEDLAVFGFGEEKLLKLDLGRILFMLTDLSTDVVVQEFFSLGAFLELDFRVSLEELFLEDTMMIS